MAAVWPSLVNRLVTLLPTLTGWSAVQVHDGPPVATESQLYCTVGYVEGDESGGGFTQTQDSIDGMFAENGEVRCELVTWSGDTSMATLRATAFTLVDAVENYRQANDLLGVLPPSSTTEAIAVDVIPMQTRDGAVLRIAFTFVYFARS